MKFTADSLNEVFFLEDHLHVVTAKMTKDGDLVVFVANDLGQEVPLGQYPYEEPVYDTDPGDGKFKFLGFRGRNTPKWKPEDERH